MYLELADNYLADTETMNFEMLPVLDPGTGEIYMINVEAFLLLNREEQIEVVNQAPFLLQKIIEQSGGMDAGLFSKIREGVSNFVQKAANVINPNVDPAGVPKTGQLDKPFSNQKSGIVTPMEFDPKFAFSASLEPSPKPWFARTEVLLPVLAGGALIAFFAFRKR